MRTLADINRAAPMGPANCVMVLEPNVEYPTDGYISFGVPEHSLVTQG